MVQQFQEQLMQLYLQSVGTTYGAGNGSTTFNVPDLQDNVPVGKSGTKALASTGGANTVASTGNVGGSTANATLSTAQAFSLTHVRKLPWSR